jgi:hypothetical protein
MISRGLELGENRILAGMYSPLDVIGGRMLAEAVVAANASLKLVKFQQAHATFYKLTHSMATTFPAIAHAGTTATSAARRIVSAQRPMHLRVA